MPLQREYAIQTALMAWTLKARAKYPELNLLFAIINESPEGQGYMVKMKRLGLKSGVPDLFLPVARDPYHGLFLEMKAPKGRLSQNQILWHLGLEQQSYMVKVAWSLADAQLVLGTYLEGAYE